jgi:hypothetical protein
MGLLAIRAALADNILSDPNFSDFEVYAYEVKDPRRPAIIVGWPETYDPRADYAGDIDLIIPVRVEIVWLDDAGTDDMLMSAMENLRDAIETDRTLQNNVDDVSCAPFEEIGTRTSGDDTVIVQFSVPVEIMY